MFSKPADMFDRDEEWAALCRFAADERPGATLGVVSDAAAKVRHFCWMLCAKRMTASSSRRPRPLTPSRCGG